MEQEDLLNKKTLYTLTGASAVCWGAVGIFNDIFHNNPPFSPTLLILVLAMLTSLGSTFSGVKKKKDFSLFIAVLFNTILITTSALGIHGINQSGDSVNSGKDTLLKESSIITFVDKYPWLPPAKLVNEIIIKEEKIDNLKGDICILDTQVVVLNRNISKTRQEILMNKGNDFGSPHEFAFEKDKSENKIIDFKSPRDSALEQEKQGYDAVAKNDFKSAMQYFKNAEELYPMLHNNFEIYSYLKKNEKSFETKADEIKKTINTKYSWKAPVHDSKKEKTDIKVDKKKEETKETKP